jgi:hypothetical protein
MKKLLGIVAISVLAASAFAQGTVVFQNITGTVQQWTSATDPALISVAKGGGFVELLAAPSGTALASSLVSVTAGGAAVNYSSLEGFLAANPGWAAVSGAITGLGNPVAGYFSGGTVTIGNIAAGASAEYTVIGWTGSAATFDAALAASGTFFGQSPMFTTGTGDPTATPPGTATSLKTTFTGMVLAPVVPEPATFALAGLGLAALLVFRRRS